MSVAGCERTSRGAGAACKHGQLLALRTAARQPCCRTPTNQPTRGFSNRVLPAATTTARNCSTARELPVTSKCAECNIRHGE